MSCLWNTFKFVSKPKYCSGHRKPPATMVLNMQYKHALVCLKGRVQLPALSQCWRNGRKCQYILMFIEIDSPWQGFNFTLTHITGSGWHQYQLVHWLYELWMYRWRSRCPLKSMKKINFPLSLQWSIEKKLSCSAGVQSFLHWSNSIFFLYAICLLVAKDDSSF